MSDKNVLCSRGGRSVEAFAGIDLLDLDDPTWLLPQPSD
jgi:hypothetical protein